MTDVRGDMPLTLINENSLVQGARVLNCPYAKVEGWGLIHCDCKDKHDQQEYSCSNPLCFNNIHCVLKKALKEDIKKIAEHRSNYIAYAPHKKQTIQNVDEVSKLVMCYANYLMLNVHTKVVPIALEIINSTLASTKSNNERLRSALRELEQDYRYRLAHEPKFKERWKEGLNFISSPDTIINSVKEKLNSFEKVTVESLLDKLKESENDEEQSEEKQPNIGAQYTLQVEIPDKKTLEEMISVIKAEEFLNIQIKVYKNLN